MNTSNSNLSCVCLHIGWLSRLSSDNLITLTRSVHELSIETEMALRKILSFAQFFICFITYTSQEDFRLEDERNGMKIV